jgi:hypothetical protein
LFNGCSACLPPMIACSLGRVSGVPQKRLKRVPTHQVKQEDACDTSFSKGSLQAALRACGAVCSAIDRVVASQYNNAFCVVRPPGHHAGVSGLLVDSDMHSSCGFCIFNSVAIGAMHALHTHVRGCEACLAFVAPCAPGSLLALPATLYAQHSTFSVGGNLQMRWPHAHARTHTSSLLHAICVHSHPSAEWPSLTGTCTTVTAPKRLSESGTRSTPVTTASFSSLSTWRTWR